MWWTVDVSYGWLHRLSAERSTMCQQQPLCLELVTFHISHVDIFVVVEAVAQVLRYQDLLLSLHIYTWSWYHLSLDTPGRSSALVSVYSVLTTSLAKESLIANHRTCFFTGP